jgi:acetyl esterase/lipase
MRRAVRVRPVPTSRAASVLAVALLATVVGGSRTRPEVAAPSTTLAHPPEVDVPYGDPVGCGAESSPDCRHQQTLDIYRSRVAGPNPVLVWVHGGGFVGGDKGTGVNEAFQRQLDDGWDIVAVNYRLTDESGRSTFPTGLLDVKRAIRWIKANAAERDWDPQRVAAVGMSAGGNLVEMLAATAGAVGLEPTGLPPRMALTDSSILGAVALAPVSDLATFRQDPGFADDVDRYLGCRSRCPVRMARGSVPMHVTPSAAPVLAIHGDRDPLAQPSQGQLVADAYARAGIADRFELIVVTDGPADHRGHDPDVGRFRERIDDFLDRLRQSAGPTS